jgi:hypothetical protein
VKKILLTLLFALVAVSFAAAESGKVSFMEGDVKIKAKSGQTKTADMGMGVGIGDTVITGKDGYCEVALDNGSTIKINSGSVFTIAEREDKEEKGKKRSVFQTIVGVVTCKFQKFTGKEPYIATPTTVCGVRGTEFTIVAGADGSALYVVDSGAVSVSAQGEEVILAPEEGVKVLAGQKPGRKFEVKSGSIDYKKVSAETETAMMSNPAGILDIFFNQLKEYEAQASGWKKMQSENIELVKKLRKEMDSKRESMAKDDWKALYDQTVTPREMDTTFLMLNSRYYAIGALSFRRYLISGLYIHMRTKYIIQTDSVEWKTFKEKYDALLIYFDDSFVKAGYFEEGDI